ncbi:MAG: NFACT family protein [Lachnospiraceae bacterium]|nr:NFACT family protein [Lachnospiraceae bacterium]
MALDGITMAAICRELNNKILNSRIYKIAQPEEDEILLTLKTQSGQYRLLISAGASLPFLYLTEDNKPSPAAAPNFCMLLRKHIQNGRITAIRQPSLERILMLDIDHLNEMGDMCQKTLVIEIMGKHSNIIFLDDKGMIIDSIKHISSAVSSVREVLPGRDYFIPNTQDKADPLSTDREEFTRLLTSRPMPAAKAVYSTFTGFSPVMAEELLYRSSLDSSVPASEYSEDELLHLYNNFSWLIESIGAGDYSPNIILKGGDPVEFAPVRLARYDEGNYTVEEHNSISYVLQNFYSRRNTVTRIRQKSSDLRRIVTTLLERNVKKYDLQLKQLKDTGKKDKYRVYGELLNTYGYNLEPGLKSFEADNYYTGEKITIPLDPTLTASENAKKYFDRYGKLKRTEEALTTMTAETKGEIDHLESIQASLDIALYENDLTEIRDELIQSGYIHKKTGNKKKELKSKPFHYVNQDSFHIYVGKNNFQNDYITFKFSSGNDWWFHAKQIPGSHVLVKSDGRELTDRTFEEAGALAAYYSKGREQDKVEIDYVQKKEVKKPAGAKPGFVVYYTNYSLVATPSLEGLTLIEE